MIICQISGVLIFRRDGLKDAYYNGYGNCMKVAKTLLELLENEVLDFWAIIYAIVLTEHLNLG